MSFFFHLQTTNEPMIVVKNDILVCNDSMKEAGATIINNSNTFHMMSDIEKKSIHNSVKKLYYYSPTIVLNFLLLVIMLLGMMYV